MRVASYSGATIEDASGAVGGGRTCRSPWLIHFYLADGETRSCRSWQPLITRSIIHLIEDMDVDDHNAERLLVEDEAQKLARLALAVAVRRVIANGLHILGVAAPEHM